MTEKLVFPVSRLRALGRWRFEAALPPEAFQNCLSGGGALVGPVQVALDFEARGERVDFRGQVSGHWELECGRCLARPNSRYATSFEGAVAGGTIDAAEEVRQALVLAVPLRNYCRPDCLGLCPVCRVNRNLAACRCVAAQDLRH